MTSRASTAEFILNQVADAGAVSVRKMFGEYALFCDGKLTALIFDGHLLVKPTDAGRTHIGSVTEAPPYKGAKPYFLVSGDRWDDRAWLAALIRLTSAELVVRSKPPRRKARKRAADAVPVLLAVLLATAQAGAEARPGQLASPPIQQRCTGERLGTAVPSPTVPP